MGTRRTGRRTRYCSPRSGKLEHHPWSLVVFGVRMIASGHTHSSAHSARLQGQISGVLSRKQSAKTVQFIGCSGHVDRFIGLNERQYHPSLSQ